MKNNNDSINIFGAPMEAADRAVWRAVCHRRLGAELSGEFTIPDYLPEMRKLLRVNVIPAAPSKFISEGSVQFGGSVEYFICYVGADGKPYGASFSDDYSLSAAFDPDSEYDSGEGVTADADISVESVFGKVIGARKLSLKSRISANVIALGCVRENAPAWLSEPMHTQTQKLIKVADYCRQMMGSNDEIELRDTLDLPTEGARFICAECGIFLEEVRPGDGYADCRGSVKVNYLLCREGERAPYAIERSFTLSEIVEIDGISEGAKCTAYCSCTGIDTSENGDGGLDVTLRLRLSAVAFSEERGGYVSDAFSTVYESSCDKKTTSLPILGCCEVKNMTFDGSYPIEKLVKSGVKPRVEIVSTAVSALAGGLEPSEDGRAAVTGTVSFNILYSAPTEGGEGESDELCAAEVELPFRLNGWETLCDATSASCNACGFDPHVKVSGGELLLSCEIGVSAWSTSKVEIAEVREVALPAELSDKRGGISICYPGSGDSVWSIAKKYRAAVDSVTKDNALPTDIAPDDERSLQNIKYLIV